MAKKSGLGQNMYVGGYNLSGDVGTVGSISGGPALLPATGIDVEGMERMGGRRSGAIEWTSYFNDAAGRAHPTLSTLPRTDVHLMYCTGTTLGDSSAALIGKQIGYDATLADDGGLSFALSAQSNRYGIEWGKLLTAGLRSDTGATNGDSLDHGEATSYGLQAYLQVISFAGTDVTIKLQESSDDGVGDAFGDVTGGGFTEVTSGPTTERIATAVDLAVERYLRVVTTTSAGFTELTFAVTVVRNLATPVF
jgi:hypothetical protein